MVPTRTNTINIVGMVITRMMLLKIILIKSVNVIREFVFGLYIAKSYWIPVIISIFHFIYLINILLGKIRCLIPLKKNLVLEIAEGKILIASILFTAANCGKYTLFKL